MEAQGWEGRKENGSRKQNKSRDQKNKRKSIYNREIKGRQLQEGLDPSCYRSRIIKIKARIPEKGYF